MTREEFQQLAAAGKVAALSAGITPSTVNRERRTVDIVFFTGIDVPRYWGGETVMLRLDPAGADLALLNNGAPILDNHWLTVTSDQKGRVENARVQGGKYLATLRFSKRKSVDELWQDIEDRIVCKFSMGLSILEKREEKSSGSTRLVVATKWQPYEISTAPVPADFGTTTLTGTLPGRLSQQQILLSLLLQRRRWAA